MKHRKTHQEFRDYFTKDNSISYKYNSCELMFNNSQNNIYFDMVFETEDVHWMIWFLKLKMFIWKYEYLWLILQSSRQYSSSSKWVWDWRSDDLKIFYPDYNINTYEDFDNRIIQFIL